MNGNIRVGTLFGIPFYINPSWFLIFGLVTLSYGGDLARFPQLGGILPWLLGFVAAILLFSSVLAHELGHSFVALKQGIQVKSISLFLFGGLANLEKESANPLDAFLIAIAGPLVSLFLWGLLTLIYFNVALPLPIAAIVSLLASINFFLGMFNLIPGLPLDGGNILKALVWKITGNANRGIIFASRVGQIFGWAGVSIGILGTLGLIPFGNFWTLLIGGFLLQNAGFSAQSAKVQETLNQYVAQDAVTKESPIILDTLDIREFVNNYVIGKTQWKRFLVVDETGKLQGAIAIDDLKTIPTSQWNTTVVKELVKPVPETNLILAEESLLEVTKKIEETNQKELTVVTENGILIGLLEKTSIIAFLQKQTLESTKLKVES
jgi:Zn-dependent protease